MQKKPNHKFVSRETGRPVYYSTDGARTFAQTKAAQKFKYIGPISAKDQEREENEALAAADAAAEEAEEIQTFNAELEKKKPSKKKTAESKKLSGEEIAELFKGKKSEVGTGTDDDDDEEEDDEDDEDEENDGGPVDFTTLGKSPEDLEMDKKLKAEIDALKAEKDGETKTKTESGKGSAKAGSKSDAGSGKK